MKPAAKGWEKSDLGNLNANGMDVARIQSLIANIDASMAASHSPFDARKLRSLKEYFENELKNRGL